MGRKNTDLNAPTSVYQTNRLSAYLALIMPLLPSYVIAVFCAVQSGSSWIFWAICIPVLTIWTFVFYTIFDCSRSKSIEFHSYNKTLVIRGFIYPMGFFDVLPKKQVALKYSDICRSKLHHSKGSVYYTIFTHDSKFRFMEHFDRAEELFNVLTSIADKNNHSESKSERSYKTANRLLWTAVGVLMLSGLIYVVIVTVV